MMRRKSTNILYTYTALRSFVRADLLMLRKHFAVQDYVFRTDPKWLTPWSLLRQCLFLLFTGWRYDYFVCFFAGYHSVLPAIFARLTGKKCILFLGGTECFNYPSFRYGNFTRKWYGKATCVSAHNASLLVPASANLLRSESAYYAADSTTQGIYHWCKGLEVPARVIGLEYDANMFRPLNMPRPLLSFITVAFGIGGTSFVRKGVDKVLMLAGQLPEATFTIVGCREDEFPVTVPSNVNLIPPVPYHDLPLYYNQHQFYLQLSIAEGFPSAICEAILCGCIPIGSNVAAIPDIIGEFGFLVHHRDDREILETVRKAIAYESKQLMAQGGRDHIMQQYGQGKREHQLIALFTSSSSDPI